MKRGRAVVLQYKILLTKFNGSFNKLETSRISPNSFTNRTEIAATFEVSTSGQEKSVQGNMQ